jgi:hypothetical protein
MSEYDDSHMLSKTLERIAAQAKHLKEKIDLGLEIPSWAEYKVYSAYDGIGKALGTSYPGSYGEAKLAADPAAIALRGGLDGAFSGGAALLSMGKTASDTATKTDPQENEQIDQAEAERRMRNILFSPAGIVAMGLGGLGLQALLRSQLKPLPLSLPRPQFTPRTRKISTREFKAQATTRQRGYGEAKKEASYLSKGLTGAGTGALAGGISGGLTSPEDRTHGALIGAGAGGLVGGGLGGIVHKMSGDEMNNLGQLLTKYMTSKKMTTSQIESALEAARSASTKLIPAGLVGGMGAGLVAAQATGQPRVSGSNSQKIDQDTGTNKQASALFSSSLNSHPALKGKQSTLPDKIQAGIIKKKLRLQKQAASTESQILEVLSVEGGAASMAALKKRVRGEDLQTALKSLIDSGKVRRHPDGDLIKESAATATKTDPQKWEQAKAEARAKMGGKHSARAMQLATKIYKDKGGGYSGAKPSASNNSLKKWTKQDWNWTGGDKPGEGGRGVYLPKQKADRLRQTEEGKDRLEKAARQKREATRQGEQYSSHGLAANTSLKK